MKNFTSLNLPDTLKISSSGIMIPLEFFGRIFPLSKKVQFKLGYFSSNSIKTLCYGFAQFIYNGGSIDFLINHFVSDEDYKLINNELEINDKFYEKLESEIMNDLSKLTNVLTKNEVNHFYNCLRYLIDKNRITITPVTTKGGEISHYKEALFWDNHDNIINIVGSCNFTQKGIVFNGESFMVNRSWGSDAEKANITKEKEEYKLLFARESKDFIYLDSEKLINIIKDKSISHSEKQLLEEEFKLIDSLDLPKISKIQNIFKEELEDIIKKHQLTPKFPFNGEPRPYQIEAYENWIKNEYKGLFGMATGTGKTKTSLNCLLNEFEKTKSYLSIILVPSIALLNQWEEEVLQFNFQNIIKVGGGNNWEKEFSNFTSNYLAGIKKDLIIISTYNSFCTPKFQKYFKKIEKNFTLIADEAHNLGAQTIKKSIKDSNIEKKIGLSATPKRIYDLEGSDFIDSFFNDKEPYTYSFSMKQALDEEYLTQYKYYPYIVELSEGEFEKYTEISKKLLRYFDFENGVFKKDPMVEKLLLLRKNIIHKAENKVSCFKDILLELKRIDKLKYIFCYIPEGYAYDEDRNAERLLDKFLIAGNQAISDLKMNSYIGDGQNLQEILRGFSEGKIDLLFAMKMLDEGVDIPRAEIGIFASSTGNPRQFIQRRGRLLRLHKDKPFATIFDMVVIPKLDDNNKELFNMERNLVKNELRRVGYFASLSMNFYDSRNSLEQVCRKYNLDLDTIINEL